MSRAASAVRTAALTVALGGATGAQAAHYYEAQTTTDAGNSGTVAGWVDGDRARIEFRDGDPSGMFPAGTYILSTDGGRTMSLVNPAERTISQIDFTQIFQMVGAIMDATAGLVRMEFDDFTSEKLSEAPGETILGYPTTHMRFRSGYTMRMRVLGMGQDNRTDVEQEIWCTDAVDAAGFDVWLRPDRFRTGNADIDQLIESQFADVDCLPLRNRMVTTSTGGRGRQSTVTSVTEVTALREETPSEETFVLPTGYEVVPLLELPMAGGGTGGASGADGEAPAESGERRRPRLRDLIGR